MLDRLPLNGYKTYLSALLLGLAFAANYLGYVDDELLKLLVGLLSSLGLISLRHGVEKVKPPSLVTDEVEDR